MRVFRCAAAFLFLTPEERDLVAEHSDAPLAPSAIVGSGLEAPEPGAQPHVDLASIGVRAPFMLYLGRIDPNKVQTLLRQVHAARRGRRRSRATRHGGTGQHAAAGPPDRADGSASSTRRRETLLSAASVLVVPSPYGKPEPGAARGVESRRAGARQASAAGVLKGQVLRANGGLHYRSFDEFSRLLSCLLDHPDVGSGAPDAEGRAYVDREYRWPHVMEKIEAVPRAAIQRRVSDQRRRRGEGSDESGMNAYCS